MNFNIDRAVVRRGITYYENEELEYGIWKGKKLGRDGHRTSM